MNPDGAATALLVGFEGDLANHLHGILARGGYAPSQVGKSSITVDFLTSTPHEVVLARVEGRNPERGIGLLRDMRIHTDAAALAILDNPTQQLRLSVLNAGADDVIDDPYDGDELLLRVGSLQRRCNRCRKIGRLCFGDIMIDQVNQRFLYRGRNIALSRMELQLLRLLAQAGGESVSTAVLVAELWGRDDDGRRQSLRVLIRKLRSKIDPENGGPGFLANDFGVGYRLRRSPD